MNMRNLLILLLLGVLISRLWFSQSRDLIVGTVVKVVIPTIDYPEQRDSQTVVSRGDWELKIDGYTDFMPGDVVVAYGVVERVGSKNVIKSDKAEVIAGADVSFLDGALIMISKLRRIMVSRFEYMLPEPMSSLAAGILLGVKRSMPWEFYQELVNTGTLHIVAASGYNVMVVAQMITAIMIKIARKDWAIGLSVVGIWGYVILSLASSAVVRAGIMGSLTLISYYWGRQTQAKGLLWVTVWLMLMFKPEYMFEVGFELSVAATLGLLYLEPWIKNLKSKVLPLNGLRVKFLDWATRFMDEFLWPTIAATVATAPVIWLQFGRASTLGILVNMLILPVVPLIMLLSALSLILPLFSYLLYVPLWWMVWVIRFFG